MGIIVQSAAAVVALLAGAADAPMAVRVTQLTIQQRVIIRVPTAAPRPVAPVEWRERRGPSCIAASDLAGAQVSAADSVDLLLRGGQRLRARLKEDCPFLGYYSGFYLRPGGDGKICADRDSIRARSGGQCAIDKFRELRPKAARAR